jgi:hypothetical protein
LLKCELIAKNCGDFAVQMEIPLVEVTEDSRSEANDMAIQSGVA